MTPARLLVLMNGAQIGDVKASANAKYEFTYLESWRSKDTALPLSLSMPMAQAVHPHKVIESFISGLLPDSEQTLERWARQFHVSARNAFALISHVGEDCPGAVQFIRPERMAAMTAPSAPKIAWLSKRQIGERLRQLKADPSAWRKPSDHGQFSLPGAQPKTALYRKGGRWGIPEGRTPTTHILKPPIAGHDGHVENEHFCLSVARAMGLPTANTAVEHFDGEIAIVVERFDRYATAALAAQAAAESAAYAASQDANAAMLTANTAARAAQMGEMAKTLPILRLHQEDMCQALGLPPGAKYQAEGGPSADRIVALLREHSSAQDQDIETFVGALIFNWLIGGSDAHAKNYALLHGGGGQVRLAPLYDVASILPYPGADPKRVKLAMKIGGEYAMEAVGPRQWRKFAMQANVDPDLVVRQALEMARALPEAARSTRAACTQAGLTHPILDMLTYIFTARAHKIERSMKSG